MCETIRMVVTKQFWNFINVNFKMFLLLLFVNNILIDRKKTIFRVYNRIFEITFNPVFVKYHKRYCQVVVARRPK